MRRSGARDSCGRTRPLGNPPRPPRHPRPADRGHRCDRSLAGDVFLLGTTSWRIRRIERGRVRVEDAHGAAPSIPFWNGEAPGRTDELSREVSRLREDIAARPRLEAIEFLMRECALDQRGAEQAADYVVAGKATLGAMPTH